MKTKSSLLVASLALALSLGTAQAAPSAVKTVKIDATDMMRFSVTRIVASPGETLEVVLHSSSTLPKAAMAHNWVLLAAGESPEAYAAASVSDAADGFEPAALRPKVLAEIPLLGPGETQSVTFTAPTTPGTYTYMCSFPAHCAAGMRGVLVVR